MKEKSFGERGVGLVVIIGVVAIFAFGSVAYLAVRKAPARPGPGGNIAKTSAVPDAGQRTGNILPGQQPASGANLRAELEMALKELDETVCK